uniref:glycosyltransferase family 2 protein n=1 Tax=uncultured Draconibacterium sp. TaxID=1573823 RepID=UPI00321658EC
MELVSVIVPCYNDGEYLKEAVRSVLKSTYKAIEIIIVNDGSTDCTLDVASELCQENSNVQLIDQLNSGLPTARNNGINLAKGKYILPLDADDLISPDYIENAITLLESDKNVSVVYCRAEFFGNKTGEWRLKTFTKENLAKDNMIFCSAVYRKKEWGRVGGYSTEMNGGWEDWEFWISLLKDGGEVVCLPVLGFFYRIKSGSMRKGMNKELKHKKIDFLNKKHKTFFEAHLNGPLRKQRSMSKIINFTPNLFWKRLG